MIRILCDEISEAAALLFATGWLDGELTGWYGVGIEEDANVHAPYLIPGLTSHKATAPIRKGSAGSDQVAVK